jgi:hypothetical protein
VFSMRRNWQRLCQLMLLVVVAGCSKGGMTKVVVSGDVSYKGQPVNNGQILFYPTGNTQGPVSGASIKDGHYEAVGKGGVPVGTHRVVINGYRAAKIANQAAAQAAAAMEGESGTREQYLPAKFNDKSTLEVTVDAGQSRAVKDFQLTD